MAGMSRHNASQTKEADSQSRSKVNHFYITEEEIFSKNED
jgi:hypothetical protein